MYTMQSAYDTIRSHFMQEGAALGFVPVATLDSSGGDKMLGVCRYVGPDGRRCAVGVLLPNDYVTTPIEGAGIVDDSVWDEIVALEILDFEGEEREYRDFLRCAQNAHDTVAQNGGGALHFVMRLDTVALEAGLDVPTVGDPRFDDVLARVDALDDTRSLASLEVSA